MSACKRTFVSLCIHAVTMWQLCHESVTIAYWLQTPIISIYTAMYIYHIKLATLMSLVKKFVIFSTIISDIIGTLVLPSSKCLEAYCFLTITLSKCK